MDQIEFGARVKYNSFIYVPKGDPYHRDNWRQLYPAGRRAELAELVRKAKANHIRFTYALAPGLSVCYSNAADYTAITAKLQQLYDIGVRSFALPVDDIEVDDDNDYVRQCAADQQHYGAPTKAHMAHAQVELLNKVQRSFLDTSPGTAPLITVPTDYCDIDDSPYKSTYRAELDSRVQVMWTGYGVTPTSIEVSEAAAAEAIWGRKPLVWDNYPTNDYEQATGRLLMGQYDERKAGISAHLSGITANPMNLPSASKVVLFGMADFTWNENAYEPDRATRQFAEWLGDGPDGAVTQALLAFFDLNNLAPVADNQEDPNTGEDIPADPWLPQTPGLAVRVAQYRQTFQTDPHQAIDTMWDYAEIPRTAPQLIRTGTTDAGSDAWLDALSLWADALETALVGEAAQVDGDETTAQAHFAEANQLVAQARAIQVPPGQLNLPGPVRLGDGVLDTFIESMST
ncbi:protein O-GlcNAcase [Actinokineospora auranticolor]|uniref:Beta-N-acetylglucosaminidase n=1 Tax=Actinokineospora auranticolor TaxID=155976 RepID=A0A2S6GF21_9PSEU|nr:protein O-GlcNAcase [Actinokineospora auranticolor]PPK63824.1 beta-N-acetylglucosaminidase [Actinokineospora auranticolor]